MLRNGFVCAVAFGVATLPLLAQISSTNAGAPLSVLVPTTYAPNGQFIISPGNSFHSAHFDAAFQSNFNAVNSALGTELSLLPIISPASGFTFIYDPVLGGYTRAAQSFGPILTERAETIGKGRFFFGAAYQYFRFDSLDGISLNNIPVVFKHEQQVGAPYEKDFISTQTSINLKVNQWTVFATYGITNRVDVSLAVPIMDVGLDVYSNAVIQRVAAPSPRFGQAHYFDPADPNNSINKQFTNRGAASGFGDVTVRSKWTVWKGERNALALAADVRFPSGDAKNLLGSGAFGFKPFVAASFPFGRFSPHANAGYEINGNSLLAGNPLTGLKGHLPNQFLYSAGLDVGVVKRLTVAFDVLGQEVFNAQRIFSSSYQSSVPLLNGTNPVFSDITLRKQNFNMVNGAGGFKVDLGHRLLLSANLLFKMNDSGLRANVVPLVGVSYTH